MKKIIFLLSMLTYIFGFAQENKNQSSEVSTEEMATVQATRLALQLDLTEEQHEKLKLLYKNQILKMQKSMEKEQTLDKPAKYNEEHSEEFKTGLKDILTEEQFIKWEQLQEKRRKGRSTPVKNN